MPDERYTVVRNGQFYNADKPTIEALRLIREWPNAAEEFFQRGVAEGRIVEGPAAAQTETQARAETVRPALELDAPPLNLNLARAEAEHHLRPLGVPQDSQTARETRAVRRGHGNGY